MNTSGPAAAANLVLAPGQEMEFAAIAVANRSRAIYPSGVIMGLELGFLGLSGKGVYVGSSAPKYA